MAGGVNAIRDLAGISDVILTGLDIPLIGVADSGISGLSTMAGGGDKEITTGPIHSPSAYP
jgi:hypothetical protein